MAAHIVQPELLHFTDDGSIPNSRYPLIVYRNAFSERDKTEHVGSKKPSLPTTGLTHGATEFFHIITITALHMKYWVYIAALHCCTSVAKKDKR